MVTTGSLSGEGLVTPSVRYLGRQRCSARVRDLRMVAEEETNGVCSLEASCSAAALPFKSFPQEEAQNPEEYAQNDLKPVAVHSRQ